MSMFAEILGVICAGLFGVAVVTYGCAGATAVQVVDLVALENGCVAASATRQAAIDCRNNVRSAWAAANKLDVAPLEGGSR